MGSSCSLHYGDCISELELIINGFLVNIVGTILSIVFCSIVLDNLAKLDVVDKNKMLEFKKWLIGLRTTFLIASIISLNFSEIDIVILFSSVLGSFLNIAILVELYGQLFLNEFFVLNLNIAGGQSKF